MKIISTVKPLDELQQKILTKLKIAVDATTVRLLIRCSLFVECF